MYIAKKISNYCNKNSRKIKNILYREKVLDVLSKNKNNLLNTIPNEITKLIFYYVNELFIGEIEFEMNLQLKKFKNNTGLKQLSKKHIRKMNFFWQYISLGNLTYKFIKVYEDYLDWNVICQVHPFTIEQIKAHYNKIHWDELIQNKYMTAQIFKTFQIKFVACIYLMPLQLATLLGEKFFIENFHRFVFKTHLLTQLSYDFSLEFVKKYKHQLDWNNISAHRELTETFVNEFEYNLNLNIVLESNVTFIYLSNEFLSQKIQKINIFVYLENCGFWETQKKHMNEDDIKVIDKLCDIFINCKQLKKKPEHKYFLKHALEKNYFNEITETENEIKKNTQNVVQ